MKKTNRYRYQFFTQALSVLKAGADTMYGKSSTCSGRLQCKNIDWVSI